MEPQPTTTTTAVSSGNSSKTPTPPALRRRRVRTTNENRTTAVLSRAAKTEFGSVVSSAIDRLQRKHGYAPERAARAILQEITAKAFEKAAASPSSLSAANSQGVGDDDNDKNVKRRNNNQEDQLYGLMQTLQIGSEQALRVLTVSLAIEEMCRQNRQSPAEALADLTSHLRTANLVDRSGDDDATISRVPRITGDEDAGLTTTSSSAVPSASSVKPAKTRPRPMECSSRIIARSHKKPKLATTASVASAAATRPRADSLSNDVTAKLEDSKVAAAVAPSSAAAAPSQAKPATPALSRNVSTSSNNNNNKRGEPSGGTTMISSSNNKRARHVVGSNNGPNAAVATTMPRHS